MLDGFLATKWDDINCDNMEDNVKQAKKALTARIKGQIRKYNAYGDFTKHLKKWTVFVELIMELTHESMTVDDDRHWSEVRKIVNKSDFKVTSSTDLAELWGLNIMQHDETIKDLGEKSK
jgi:long-subunit acyl-CoA synthetase (AMP-forming)